MDWSYIAGYFDGEGHVSNHLTKRRTRTHALCWYNTHRPSLESMRDFMGAGKVYVTRALPNRPINYVLRVTARRDLLRILEHMMPHLLVKREQAGQLYDYVLHYVTNQSANFGRVAAVSSAQLLEWYSQGESFATIANRLGVSGSSIAQAFRTRQLARRGNGGALKGKPKSAETRARMKAAAQLRWGLNQ